MSLRHSFLCAAGLSAFIFLGSLAAWGQPVPPGGPDMGPQGAPAFDPENPPQEPPKPVPPAHLELPVDWLGERDKMLSLCDNFLEVQFASVEASQKPTDNPLVQRFRECLSDKYIVTEWARERPLNMSWTYPVLAPEHSIDEIEVALQKELEKDAEEKYPLLSQREYEKEARKKYRMYRYRENVVIPLLHGGRGVSRRRKGIFLGVGNGQVKLAPRQFIYRMDMSDEVAAHFFHFDHERMVKKYVENAIANSKLERKSYVHYNMMKLMPKKLSEDQYVPNHIDFLDKVTVKTIFKKEHWISRQNLVLKQQELLWKKNLGEGALGEKLKKAFMHSQGYVFLSNEESEKYTIAFRKDEENRHKGWILAAHFVKMRKWMAAFDKYNRDLANYDTEMQRYKEAKITWDAQKKEYDRQQGNSEDDEDEE